MNDAALCRPQSPYDRVLAGPTSWPSDSPTLPSPVTVAPRNGDGVGPEQTALTHMSPAVTGNRTGDAPPSAALDASTPPAVATTSPASPRVHVLECHLYKENDEFHDIPLNLHFLRSGPKTISIPCAME